MRLTNASLMLDTCAYSYDTIGRMAYLARTDALQRSYYVLLGLRLVLLHHGHDAFGAETRSVDESFS